jgi:hypothetical protein
MVNEFWVYAPWVALVAVLLVGQFVLRRLLDAAVRQTTETLLNAQRAARQHGAPVYSTLDDLDEAKPEPVRLPVVKPVSVSCASCNHFNLAAGQRSIEAHPAFQRATTHLQPWQMARERKVRPNPEYLEVEAAMKAAQAANDAEKANELHSKLLTLDPGEVLEDSEQVERAMLGLDWSKLGACGYHRELRFATDKCEHYETEV